MASTRSTTTAAAVDEEGTRARAEEDSGAGVVAAHAVTSVEVEDGAVANSVAPEVASVVPLVVVSLPHRVLDACCRGKST
jgi:hypothetical protein